MTATARARQIMPSQTQSAAKTATGAAHAPLAVRIAQRCVALQPADVPREVIEKIKTCLFDFIGCAVESRDLPWSLQAKTLAQPVSNARAGACVIASPMRTSYGDAAFANAVMGHGLVREDMHSGSVSHLGIVVLPTILALSQYRQTSGPTLCAAAAVGYEVGARVGRAAMSPEIARIHRPTGISGPIGGAAAAAYLIGLNADAMASAIALGTNTTLGFNQWAHTGGSEMFFQAGFAARNALAAARLAEAGAYASPSALDGEAGLFASLGKRAEALTVSVFDDVPEIMSVYHKPVPACNFAQTPSQAALGIARQWSPEPQRIAAIRVRVPRAGMLYPGCDHRGPFAHILQAKMSIQYNVAAALLTGDVSESNFRLLEDAALHRLIGMIELEIDDQLTRAYPGKQGAEVEVRCTGGESHRLRLEDVVNASPEDVRRRFRRECATVLGDERTSAVEDFIDDIARADNAATLLELLRIDSNSAEA